MAARTDLLQGSLDLLILKTLALEPLHGWVYGGGARFPFADMVAVGCDILGEAPEEPGSDPDILVVEPAVDLRVSLARFDVLFRLAGDTCPECGRPVAAAGT